LNFPFQSTNLFQDGTNLPSSIPHLPSSTDTGTLGRRIQKQKLGKQKAEMGDVMRDA
jgi:hypothetical protein